MERGAKIPVPAREVAPSVVVPCCNENTSLVARLKLACDANFRDDYEIVLIDNGSHDRT